MASFLIGTSISCQKNQKIFSKVLTREKPICIIRSTQEEMMKMVTLNTRDELVEFLYGANSTSPDTLVGVATIGGELLAEALSEDNLTRDGINGYIQYFFPCGDEGEYIEVDPNGNIVGDWLYY